VLLALEAEGRRQELAAEAPVLQLGGDGVDTGDLILEVGVADDDPLEAERVGLPVELRACALRDALEQLLDVALGLPELAGRQRLEDRRRSAGRLQRALGLERDCGGREREETVGRGLLQLLAAEEDVAEPGQGSVVSPAGCSVG
jgi:hypothetical protein